MMNIGDIVTVNDWSYSLEFNNNEWRHPIGCGQQHEQWKVVLFGSNLPTETNSHNQQNTVLLSNYKDPSKLLSSQEKFLQIQSKYLGKISYEKSSKLKDKINRIEKDLSELKNEVSYL